MKESVRVGFVGAGNIIQMHAAAFGAIHGIELTCITNRSKNKAASVAEIFAISAVFDDLETMMEEAEPDIVVMAVYEPAIEETISRLLAYPVTILMEKPMGIDLAAAKRVAARAKDSKAQLYVGFNRRAYGATIAALDDLDTRDEKRFVHIQDQQSLATARAIGHAEDVVKNWMFANSVHLVDYAKLFCRGDAASVKNLSPWTPDDPGIVLSSIEFSSGDQAVYEALWNGPGPWACTISTPTRRWEMRPLETAKFQNVGERILHDQPASPADENFKPGFYHQANQVVKAWRGEDNTAVNYTEGLATTRLVAAIYGMETD